MQVFFLIGSSGTGKSHRASLVAHKHDIPLIIDDGLLIQGAAVLAGKSAKREVTRLGAVKRAIFLDEDHAREVQEKIRESGLNKILILATSEKMAEQIAARLDLPQAEKVIQIEDIASSKSINTALRLRQSHNQHVIPIPTFEIKKDFPGYLIDPLKSFLKKPASPHVVVERSVVRPAYSTLGSFFIATQVLTQLVEHRCSKTPGIQRAYKVAFNAVPHGLCVSFDVTVDLGSPLVPLLSNLQETLKEELERLTGFSVAEVNVTAKRLHICSQEEV